jgi:putative transposase
MKRIFSNWKAILIIVKPETVINLHRKGFKIYWTCKSKRKGRQRIETEIIQVIKQMAEANPQWGIPRIHGEILKLGFDISESTVRGYVPKKNGRSSGQRWKTLLKNHALKIILIDFLTVPTISYKLFDVLVFLSHERKKIIHFNVTAGQRWKTFLKNHASEIISIDYFSVPTINFKSLHVLVFLAHEKRKIIHFNVTTNPTSELAAQQLKNTFYNAVSPKYLIRDRDSRFGNLFKNCVASFGIRDIVTTYRSPWQNGYYERVIGSIRREFLDHVIVISANHLRKLLKEYFHYYNYQRTHLGLDKDAPESRPAQVIGKIDKVPVANGLHNYYYRNAA